MIKSDSTNIEGAIKDGDMKSNRPFATILGETLCSKCKSILRENTSPSTELHLSIIFSHGFRESYVFSIIAKSKKLKRFSYL